GTFVALRVSAGIERCPVNPALTRRATRSHFGGSGRRVSVDGGATPSAGFCPSGGFPASAFPGSASPGPSERRKFVGPITKAHKGLERVPFNLTSNTFEIGVSTAPTTDLIRLLLSWNGKIFALKSSSPRSRAY